MKGLNNLTTYFILALILIALGLIFFNKIRSWACFINPFFCYQSKLEIAMECARVRCIKGCNHPMIEKLKKDDFDCKKFCFKDWQDKNGKICNERSYQFPIEVNLNEDKEYTKEKLEVNCIIPKDDVEFGFFEKLWDALTKDKTGHPKYIYIKKDLIKENYLTNKDNKETCIIGLTPFNSLKMFSVKDKTVYIFYNYRYWVVCPLGLCIFPGFSSSTFYIWDDCCSDCSCETKDACQQCAIFGYSCYFEGTRCHKKEDLEECTDGGPEILCAEMAEYFCGLQGKSAISSGCISNKCQYLCGDCSTVKDHTSFPNFSFCIKSRCESFDYESTNCCEKINSCGDYTTPYECQRNLCYDKVGPCFWGASNKCEKA